MANYYTAFSIIIPAFSEEERNFIRNRLTGFDDDVTIQPIIISDLDGYDHSRDACQIEENGGGLWLYDEEFPDLERVTHVIQLWQERFKKEEPVIIEYANTCSKPRLDAYGGGVIVCYKGEMDSMGSYSMGDIILKELRLRVGDTINN